MPRAIDPGEGAAIGLDELADALDSSGADLCDDDALAAFGPLLARLARNRRFLGDLVIGELERDCAGQGANNSYGAQVFLLRPPDRNYVLRANFWPARDDSAMRASGPAAFFYDLPHDHNFSFLTVGYSGPGYWSDYYEYDRGAVIGLPGEAAGLRFVERSRLAEGRVLLYRAHRDVHVQLPPDSLSVSLNIIAADRVQAWREQFRFDVTRGTVAHGLTVTPAEGLVALAVHFGGDGIGLARELARRHPEPRMRVTALDALASAAGADARAAIYEAAADDADAYVAGHARLKLGAQSAP